MGERRPHDAGAQSPPTSSSCVRGSGKEAGKRGEGEGEEHTRNKAGRSARTVQLDGAHYT